MKLCPNVRAERYRDHANPASSACAGSNAGGFYLAVADAKLYCVVSDGGGWDHVSVHVMDQKRTPTWEEMCFVKDLFFKDDEVVMQLHPAKKDYVNCHPFTLHLWRPQTREERLAIAREFGREPALPDDDCGPIPLPPRAMV